MRHRKGNAVKVADIKKVLLEGVAPEKAKVMDRLIENTINHMVGKPTAGVLMESASAGAASTTNIARLTKVVLPMLRRVFPATVSTEFVGVQAIDAPEALVPSIRYVYGNTAAGVVAGEEAMPPLHIRNLAAAYSGNQIDAQPAGGDTADMEGVPGNTLIPEVVTRRVTTKTRRMSQNLTIEARQDAESLWGIDLQAETLSAMSAHIAAEIDQEIIRRLRAIAGAPVDVYNQGLVSGAPRSVVEEFAALPVLINKVSNLIAQRSRIGKANKLVVSAATLTALEAAAAAAMVRTTNVNSSEPVNSMKVGSMNGMDLFMDSYASDNTPALVILKKDEMVAPLLYLPYIPVSVTNVMTDPQTLQEVQGVYSRYAIMDFTSDDSVIRSTDLMSSIGINLTSFI